MPAKELGKEQAEEMSELQTYHHDVQQHLQTMGSVVHTFQVYLSLAQRVQDVTALVKEASVFFGSSHELESSRVSLQVISLCECRGGVCGVEVG